MIKIIKILHIEYYDVSIFIKIRDMIKMYDLIMIKIIKILPIEYYDVSI